MPSTTYEAQSPSASSLFLPLGRRAHGDSKSSLSRELDQDALKRALNTIHTAASQSQDLTVFNEYTTPPALVAQTAPKTLAGDLQSGLTGLYNKIKLSVGVPLEGAGGNDSAVGTHLPTERPASRASSDRTSRVQSPKVHASDSPVVHEAQSHSSRLSSKATSTTKTSHSTTPSVRSPASQFPPAHLADPTLTEVNILANQKSSNHSRIASNHDSIDEVFEERRLLRNGDDTALRRVLSDTANERSDTTRREHPIASPDLMPFRPKEPNIRAAHSQVITDGLPNNRPNIPISASQPLSPAFTPQSSVADRQISDQRNPVASQKPVLDTPAIQGQHIAKVAQTLSKDVSRIPENTANTSVEIRPKDRLKARVSQSRLPGFQISRTSSTDSGITTTVSRSSRQDLDAVLDEIDDGHVRLLAARPHKLRSKLLDKEFWMRDENARDCFHCGETFTTFRRKHHCRSCGQIFDNKCTVLINGSHFGTTGAVRVCKPCEAIILSHDDDSSDWSIDDLALPESLTRPRTPESSHLSRGSRLDDDNISVYSQSLEHMSKTPTINFPVRKAFDGENKISKVLEFDAPGHSLPRPSSSRSLKTSHGIGHGHKRHHSRHQHVRSSKAYHEERAPFQRRTIDDSTRDSRSSAFHRDSIIDPDLAQYLSDEPSSGDEQSISMNMSRDKSSRPDPEIDRSAIGGLLAAVRKGRSRIGDRSIAGFLSMGKDADESSVTSSRLADGSRPLRKRNLSVASSVHQRLTPKGTRDRIQIVLPDRTDDSPGNVSQTMPLSKVSRMIRSASMHGIAAPSMELNRASIQHVHKLLQQLLRDAEVSRVASWEEALVPILLRATDDVDPDVQAGDDLDIRNYVKLKKIPGGKPCDTAYISGLIFSKNVALKSMPRLIMGPQILIISFALEYARHEQHFMSLDPVIRQEKEYLQNLVGRIAALKPDLLLAQRNVSGLALELLEKAGIVTIFNVKSSVLDAVSRCTQTRVAHSVDKLTSQSGQLGTCESFEIKTFVFEGRKKNYVYLSGCPPELGCTIAIRGTDRKTLSKIKRITEFMVYVVYNLKLETCLMRDEWALIPTVSADAAGTDLTLKRTSKQSIQDLGQSESSIQSRDDQQSKKLNEDTAPGINHSDVLTMAPAVRLDSAESADIPDDIPVPTFYEDMVDKHQTKILSASPFVKFMQPYLLMRARELERRVAYLKRLRDQGLLAESASDEKSKPQKFTLIQPEMLHTSLAGTSKKVQEIIQAVHEAEYDKALTQYEMQKRQWETYLSGNRNLFDPYAHQNIVVLFSQVNTVTSVPCSGPDLLAFGFYNENIQDQEQEFEPDCTLGQYVEDLCYRANDVCPSESCQKRMVEHHRQYVHGEAQITVFVQPYPAKMRGLQDVILMWSQCRKCGVETTVTPMSASTWKYSFGKYLELSFWSADLHARAGICPHDLHRDHLRYFGYKEMALRVHYDPIDLLEIVVPRMRVTWKVDNDLRYRNEAYTKLEHRITKFMVSVKLRLKSINVEALLPENAEACRDEIEKLTKRANEEHTMLIKLLQERYTNSPHWEVIPLNRAMRVTQEKVAEWDIAFGEFERNFFPSEKDIRRLATLQLKKIFLDRDASNVSLTSDQDGTLTPPTEELLSEKVPDSISGDDTAIMEKVKSLLPEKAQNIIDNIMQEGQSSDKDKADAKDEISKQTDSNGLPHVHEGSMSTAEVQHLDLALPQNQISTLQTPVINVPGPPQSEPVPEEKTSSGQDQSIIDHVKISSIPRLVTATSHDPTGHYSHLESLQLTQTRTEDANQPTTPPREIGGRPNSPKLIRAHSQPAGSAILRREASHTGPSLVPNVNVINGFGSLQHKTNPSAMATVNEISSGEKKLSERLGLTHLKNSKFVKNHSLIPRVIGHRRDTRVSNLAKYFEQLSREFERERISERKLRAARSRHARVYPLAASKPIVEVYKDVDEAVDEANSSDDIFEFQVKEPDHHDATAVPEDATKDNSAEIENTSQDTNKSHAGESHAELTECEGDAHGSSHAPSEADDRSDIDESTEDIHLPDSPEDLLRMSQEEIDLKELPKHERSSLVKMLTNFWAERSSSGWSPLDYPMTAFEHVFADCDIIVREDEPSSIIAFALDSSDYKTMLHNIQDRPPPTPANVDGKDMQADVMHSLLRKTGTHLKYQFQEGPAKMLCKIFFAEQFDAMRKKCGAADRMVESLSRCLKWDSKGGKTKSLFLKTLDDRFVLKSLSPVETQSFLKFAPNYFQIMSEAFFHELPSVIAKMLGFYQIIVKNAATGVEYNWYLLIMENLFYDRVPTRIFDLKGSMRNRKINATGERNEVLLDENMVEFIYESPLFAREHSKKLLRSSVHNDTLFLARQNVMDYSLMIAIDENRKELVVGIIDCIRTYTWDKKLESWIKDRGFVGGGKNRPTVTSPKEYKRRFREAMGRYVLEAPNCWHQFKPVRLEKRVLRIDGDGDKADNEVQLIT